MLWYKRFRQHLLDDPRFARILHGSFSGLLVRILTMSVSAVTLPLTLRLLGPLEYGIWITVSTMVVMLSILDLGIANTLTNFIGEANASGDRETAQHYYATAFWGTLGMIALLAPLAYGAWHIISWASVFHLTDPAQIRHAALCVGVAAGFFFVCLPLSLANRVLFGYQQTHIVNYFAMANSMLGLFAILLTAAMHGSLLTLMVTYSIAMLLGTLSLNIWLSFWHRPWIKPLPNKVKLGTVRKMFGQGSLFFVLQVTNMVVFNSDNLVITHYLGAAAVTPYSVAWRLAQYVYLLQSLLVPSLWPAFTEAYQRRQMDWVRRTYLSIRQKTMLAVGVAALLVGLFGRWLIRVWAGPTAVPGTALMWFMAAYAFVAALTTNQSVLLTATGRLRLQAGVAVLAAAANLALSIFLVQKIGSVGVIVSTVASFALFMIVPQALEVRRILSGRYLPPVISDASLDEVPVLP